eukprot:115892_1
MASIADKCSRNRIYCVLFSISMWVLFLVLILSGPIDNHKTKSLQEYGHNTYESLPPVDIVYTWGGMDASVHELRYSMRSVYQNAPWFRYIFIVLNDNQAKPNWFNESNDRVKWIKLSEIFQIKQNALNNHNSQAIEININRIDALSEYYVYLNDDWFFGDVMPIHYLFDFKQNKIKFSKHYYAHYQFRMMFGSDTIYHCPTAFHRQLKKPKHGIINVEIEHIPRPFIKSKLQRFLDEYKDWVLFVESHKKRYSSCGPDDHEESIYRTYLKQLFDEEDIVLFDEGIGGQGRSFQMLDCFNSDIAQWLLPFVPNNESWIRHLVCYENPYHLWMRSDHESSLKSAEYYLGWIQRERPYTFCLQDNWGKQSKKNYQQKIDDVMNFYESMFPNPAEWELSQ